MTKITYSVLFNVKLVLYTCFHCLHTLNSIALTKKDLPWRHHLYENYSILLWLSVLWRICLFILSSFYNWRQWGGKKMFLKAGGRERGSLKQSAALCLRTLSAFTCSVWQQSNRTFYTVWDTNCHSKLCLFLQYNLIKRHCQWGKKIRALYSLIDRQT